jgi:hypothetical protein
MWFGKAVDDFNIQIAQMGKSGPQIQASLSNGFTSTSSIQRATRYVLTIMTVLWVAYAFGAVPLMCVLMKLHHASIPEGKA